MISIPYEILTSIAEYLPVKDRLACLLVCQNWQTPFCRSLYVNVVIKTRRRFVVLLGTLRLSALSSQPRDRLGFLLRSLTLGYGNIPPARRIGVTQTELEELSILCPFLQQLDFHPRIWRSLGSVSIFAKWTRLCKLPPLDSFHIAMSLLRDLRCQLTHIKLDGDIICEQHASRTLLPFITQLQFLKHLELSDDNSRLARRDETSYTVGDFESIHVACTQLERLDISGLSISMGVHDSILSMDFTQVSAAKNMRIFNLRDVDLDDDQCIGYFLFKYPQLDELGWYSDARYFDVEYFHDNLYMAIAKQYRQLKKLHLDGINVAYWPGQTFFDILNEHGTQLQCLHIDTPLDLSQPEFSAMMKSIRHTISDLQLIIEHAQDIVHLWQSLGQCQHLVRLKIVNRTYSTLDISLILSHCRYLQILSLIEGFAVAPAVRPSRHGLLKLELVSVILDVTYIASYLSDHCPRLESLVLLTCYDHSSSERAVNIYAPHHIFKTISITQLGRIRTENTGVIFGNDVVIVSITQIKEWDSNKQKSSEQTGCKREHNQKTRWYYLHDSVPYSDKTPVVYRLDKEAIRHMIQFPSLSTAEHVDGSSRGRKKWKKHADSGYIDIVCKTVDNLLINGANIQAC